MMLATTDVTPLLEDEAAYARALGLVGRARREHIGRYRLPADRCLGLAASLLLRRCLAALGIDAGKERIDRDAGGRPYLPDRPGCHFNLSHSGRRAACVVGETPVGVDVEAIPEGGRLPVDLVLHPAERAWFSACQDGPRQFARLWTRKEAYLKATGTGLGVDPCSFVAMPGCRLPEHGGRRYALQEYALDGYALAVCAARPAVFPPLEHIGMEELVPGRPAPPRCPAAP